MTDEQAYIEQMTELCGELARYSDYKIGQRIRYRSDGMIKVGEITWVTGPGQTALGRPHPLQYWIGLDIAYSHDVIGLAD